MQRPSHFVEDCVTLEVSCVDLKVDDSVFYTPQHSFDSVDSNHILRALTTVNKPRVPYLSNLPVPLGTGSVIQFRGSTTVDSYSFCIVLSRGNLPSSDVALYFSPRFFLGNYAERKSRVSGKWVGVEMAMGQRNVFSRNAPLHMEILVAETGFMVSVYGKHFVTHKHHTDIKMADTIHVTGGLALEWIRYRTVREFPEPCYVDKHVYDEELFLESRMPDDYCPGFRVPFLGQFAFPFDVGQELVVRGRVLFQPVDFWIRLQDRAHSWPHPTVSLSLHPRFLFTKSRDTEIWLNSWRHGRWDKAVIRHRYHFQPGLEFCLSIVAHTHTYCVCVDGSVLANFSHQRTGLPSERPVNTISIRGCVEVYDITVVRWGIDEGDTTRHCCWTNRL